MLRSITSEAKKVENEEVEDRKLVFSNCEVEYKQSRKSRDRYSHCKALFNMNK
jgi:hypothetical protein